MKLSTLTLAVGGVGLVATLTGALHSSSSGIFAIGGNIDLPRKAPGCGACHRPFPGGLNLAVSLVPSARSLSPNQAISVTTSSTGGQMGANGWGGFATNATAGTFAAGANSKVDPRGLAVTHVRASDPRGRVWKYGYTAPAQPGLVEVFTVVNTVDEDGRNSGGDFWAFHGFRGTATISTPVRLFVNAAGVRAVGESCVGSFGNFPVLGAAVSPAVGNAAFAVEAHGTAPAAPAVLLAGNTTPGLDLGIIGVTGCKLWVQPLLTVQGATGAGDAERSEGVAKFPLPIPNDAKIKGAQLGLQVAIVDQQNGRTLPITMTNALQITVQ